MNRKAKRDRAELASLANLNFDPDKRKKMC